MVLSSIMEIEQQQQTTVACSSASPGPEPAGLPLSPERADGSLSGGGALSLQSSFTEPRGALRRLLADLGRGARRSLFLKFDPESLHSTPASLTLLVLADLLLNLAASFLLVGREGYFSYSAVPGFLFHLPLFLFFGLLAGKALSRPSLVTDIPAALISLSIPIELTHGVLERLSRLGRLEWLEEHLAAPHYYRFFWWWVAASLISLLRIGANRPWRRRILLPPMFLLLVLPPIWFYPRGDLWVSGSAESESGELRITDEVLSAQGKLLASQLAAMLPGRKGVADLYFVGFAGDASQDVFLKELNAAGKLFAERFGASGRSILLVNNPQTAITIPFATADNLERTLVRMGEVMDREDVLFLYVTSHGSRDHELGVENSPLELKPLTPEQLRRMLAKARIPYKVVVISACFSGGFVEPLKDPSTLIITASDATHESFGCGFGEDYTWFGQAFIGNALRRTFSFTDAFEKAREEIRKWEEEQGQTPSNPQIWGGKDVWPALLELEKELKR
ncbi:MAG TPA: peptidase [Geobacter sp.]|nr:peptidase [Geobacter sp.]